MPIVESFAPIKFYGSEPLEKHAVVMQYTGLKDKNDKDIVNELNNYAVNLNIMFDSIESLFAHSANERNYKYHQLLNNHYNDDKIPLSQKSINMINSLKEVSATLVGMRKKEYVDDVLESMKLSNIKNAEEFWKSN